MARLKRLTLEVSRFALVNVVATLVAVALFNLGVHGPGRVLHEWPLTAYLLANSVGMVLSYLGSLKFAFAERDAHGVGGGFPRYVLINLVSFAIPMACLWVSRNLVGDDTPLSDNVAANVVGALLGFLVRYWAFRTFVFRRAASPERVLGR